MTRPTDPVARAAREGDGGLGPYISALHADWLDATPDQRWMEVRGSLVFADVSGFTPLAERLARRGKVGGEQLTETLNTVFSELLDVAARFGGDCLKFGGDALLLAFTGTHDARRAAAAAHAMQLALKRLRREGDGAGLAKLGISMGVHTGTIHAFLAGSSHRELVLAGPAVSRTLELEGIADRGQILIDRATAEQLEPADADDFGDGAALLRRAPAAALHPVVAAGTRARAVDGIPLDLRAHLDGERKDGEHRLAAVGFVKFGGTDAVLADDGPAALAEALHDLVDAVQQACAAHGVTFVSTDVDRDGGKVILAGGVPSASDDDEDRLLLATRQVVSTTAGQRLRVRAGVHRGRIFAVDLGGIDRRTFTVMGDAVNLAARVMGKADWGEVVATDDVLERRRTEFVLEPLTPFAVKGKAELVHAQLVGAPLGRHERTSATAAPLVGRTREVALVRDALAAAHRGEGRVIELVGEPGIGKSRLVSAVLAHDHGLGTFSFEAGRYSLATPYFALRRGLRAAMGMTLETPPDEVEAALADVVATAAPALAPWLPLLAVPLGLELADTAATAQLDAATRQATLQHAVVELMGQVLSEPTLITIEDSHWLDGASCDLLKALFADVERRPWAVLVTRRDVVGGLDLTGVGSVLRRRLEPLDRTGLLQLAAAAAGSTPIPPGVLSDLVDRSGGNPLFLQELVNATVTGSLSEVPDTIEAVIAASIDTLPARDRLLLRHAAVLGGHVPLAALGPMVGEPPHQIEASVTRLSHFLRDEGNGFLRFSHILLRDVAYEGLPFRQRQDLHERAGEILEASVPDPDAMAELLSIHFDRARRFKESWHYSRVAGERAQRNGASVEAAAFFERALEASHALDVHDAQRAEVAERLGDTWEFGGRYERSDAAYRRARRYGRGDAAREARICRKIGFVRDHEGRYDTAQRWFRRGLAVLEQLNDPDVAGALRAELTTSMVSSKMRQGRHARAIPLIREAISEAIASDARAELAHAYCVYDQLLVDQGRYQEARHSELAAALYEQVGDHRGVALACNEMGSTAYWLGQWDEAVRSWERAIEAERSSGALVQNAIYLNNIGEVRSDQGRLDEAEALLARACELWRSGGSPSGTGWATSNLGRLASRAGRFDDAARWLDEARGLLTEIGAHALLLETDARDMERLVLAGSPDAAIALAPDLVARAQRLGIAYVSDLVARLHGCALAQSGDLEGGRELIEASLAASRSRGAEYEVAVSLHALAQVHRARAASTDAADAIDEAQATFTRLGVVAMPDVPGLPR